MIPTQSRMPPKKLQPSKCLAWVWGPGATDIVTGFSVVSVVGFGLTAGFDFGVASVLFSVSFSVTSSAAGVGLTVVSPSWVSLVAAELMVVLVTASPTVVVMVEAGVGVVSLVAAAVVGSTLLELLRGVCDTGTGGVESSWSPPGLRGWLSTVTTKATMKAMRKNAFAVIVP